MFKHLGNGMVAGAIMTAATWMTTIPVWAGYLQPGYDLQVIQSDHGLANTAVSYQTNSLWDPQGSNKYVDVNTTFTTPACQDVRFGRLYLDVWGGNNAYTCSVTASLNGTPLTTVNMGGTNDSNPTFSAAQTCVYGTGSGMWQIAYSGIGTLLKKDGTVNTLAFKVNDPKGLFDGRTACASLIAVYTDPSVNQTLDYFLAEADGTMRKTSGTNNSPSQRSLTITGIDTTAVIGATYIAGYTHGTTGEKDQVYFNGVALGGSTNDVALGTTSDYGPSNHAFDVTSLLAGSSTIRYSVGAADIGVSGESYLRANIGLLEVTHPVPEPGTLTLLAVGVFLGGALRLRRVNR